MFFPVNGDPYYENVSLLLPMTGANNSTTFTDRSPSPKTITRNGNTKILTAQSKWGNGSGYFDGSVDYLSIPTSAIVEGSPFTIEAWVYPTSFGSSSGNGLAFLDSSRSGPFCDNAWRTTASGVLVFERGSNFGYVIVSGGQLILNAWQHISLTVDGVKWRQFLNGTLVAETNNTSYFMMGTNGLRIGYSYVPDYLVTNRHMQGYLQDLRITKGIARYTENFAVPPGPLPFRRASRQIPPLIQQPSFQQIARLGL